MKTKSMFWDDRRDIDTPLCKGVCKRHFKEPCALVEGHIGECACDKVVYDK